eukprot:1836300-Prymnesium_polylepis.1
MGAQASQEYLTTAGSQYVFRNASGSNWLMMVGSSRREDSAMAVLLFSAPNLAPSSAWSYLGPAYVGGREGGAWCPYFAPIDPADPSAVMLAMADYVGRGRLSPPSYSFVNRTSFARLDAGLAHVSAVFVGPEPQGRRSIVMRWLIGAPSCAVIPGRRLGGGSVTPDCDPAHIEDVQNAWGWVGAHSLPITVGVASGPVQNSQGLSYRVVDEIYALRLPRTHRRTRSASTADGGRISWHGNVAGVALELRLNVTLPSSPPGAALSQACLAGLVVRASADGAEQTSVALRVSELQQPALVVNRTLASMARNASSPDKVQELALPSAMLGRATELAIYVDHSVIEVFVGDFAIMSTRVYPSAGNLADRVGTFVSPDCPAPLELGPLVSWAMADVYFTPSESVPLGFSPLCPRTRAAFQLPASADRSAVCAVRRLSAGRRSAFTARPGRSGAGERPGPARPRVPRLRPGHGRMGS